MVLEGSRQGNLVPRAVGAKLIEVVGAPGAEPERFVSDPRHETREDGSKIFGRIHILLPNGGELGAEVAQLRGGDRAYKGGEFRFDRTDVGGEQDRADLDDLHAVPTCAFLPAGRLQVNNNVTHRKSLSTGS